MALNQATQHAIDRLWRSGPIGAFRERRSARRFATAEGRVRLFHGLYESYAAARACAPPGPVFGRDNPLSARRLEHERQRVFASDYPVLFWLSRLLAENPFIFDLGGDVGTSYTAFRAILPYPANLTWLVQDVPAIIERGEQLAREEPAPGLRYTGNFSELHTADILLAAGSLHMLEDPIGLLGQIGPLPDHVLLNKLPLRDGASAVTLHANGTMVTPYHLLNRQRLTALFETAGYRCVDTWRNYDLNCYVPFHPDYTIPFFSGYYFRRDE